MRLLTYEFDGQTRCGVLDGDQVWPFRPGITMLEVVRAGLPVDVERWSADESVVPLSTVRVCAPLQPVTIRDFVSFEEHVEGVRKSIEHAPDVPQAWYQVPTFYFSNPHVVRATGEDIAIPTGCQELDFELEVGIVLGRGGTDIDPAVGLDHVFGLTIFNDWSARDLQGLEMKIGLGPAKGKDFANTLGPVIVTIDDFADAFDAEGFLSLGMAVWVNDTEIGRDLLSNMGWPIAELVAYASRNSRVEAGDLLGSGTAGNGGCLAELWGRNGELSPPPLQPGDTVRMWVERIGQISNRVVAGVNLPPVPRARQRSRQRPPRIDHD